jgi:predicted AlkP superfamily pyrophosphatase or phosphodiesterase
MRRAARALALCAALGFLRAAAPDAATGPPKLAVILVIDQMRADYVDRFRGDWTAGFQRLLAEGAWFRRAAYPYLTTVTCAGHATVATGAFPHRHGVFQNVWYDRDRAAVIACTEDPEVRAVRYDEKRVNRGDSAALLELPTLADRLRAARSAHVATIALKDRSAIMLAGHGGDAVTWLSNTLDGWQTSSAYSAKPIEAVERFVKANPIDADYGKTWERLLPAQRYHEPDEGVGEAPPPGWTATFPHPLSSRTGKPDFEFRADWERSPFADAYVGRFAAALVQSLGLGAHDGIDLLGVSFSSPDLVGHAFGPDSQEVHDMYLRLDRTLGALFDRLDALVGRDRYVVALTADHGVTPSPEDLHLHGRDGGRLDAAGMSAAVDAAIAGALGPGHFVARFNGNDLYFTSGVSDRLAARRGALDRVVTVLGSQPGVARVFRATELKGPVTTADRLLRAARLSYVPGRSGDLVIAPKPGWVFAASGSTHGTGNPDDQRVPILLMGRGIKHGEYLQAATPADIAPTLAVLCGITMPQAEGHVLREALH